MKTATFIDVWFYQHRKKTWTRFTLWFYHWRTTFM